MPKFQTSDWDEMLKHQPSWRRSYLHKEELYLIYLGAPCHIRADPLFYPTLRRWKWPTWETLHHKDARISYNFPMLPDQEYNSLADFQATMVNLVEAWNLIPDPTIVATCQFLKLIILLTKLKNFKDLECHSMRQVYNLSKGPQLQIIYHYFHKVKYLPINYLVTFENMFDTRLWDLKEELFLTRHTPNPIARYEANFQDKTL